MIVIYKNFKEELYFGVGKKGKHYIIGISKTTPSKKGMIIPDELKHFFKSKSLHPKVTKRKKYNYSKWTVKKVKQT